VLGADIVEVDSAQMSANTRMAGAKSWRIVFLLRDKLISSTQHCQRYSQFEISTNCAGCGEGVPHKTNATVSDPAKMPLAPLVHEIRTQLLFHMEFCRTASRAFA
jgi:hypothetical protein